MNKLQRLCQLAILFLKLGSIGFGGMAVLISMMEYEVVSKRKWLSREQLLDFVGASNLIPGPTAVEVALQIGHFRAGWWGFIVSGICFIFPSSAIAIGLAWGYVKLENMSAIAPFFNGIKAAIIAIILIAVCQLGSTAVKNWRLAIVGMVVMLASILGINEMLAIFLGGVVGLFGIGFRERVHSPSYQQSSQPKNAKFLLLKILIIFNITLAGLLLITLKDVRDSNIVNLSLVLMKIGSLMYGGGYVLIAFLQGGLVDELGWINQQQLFDAIAIGQITPGPLLSTVTFIGYLLLGVPGATVATVSIVLPGFLFSTLLNSVIPQLRRFRWTAQFLDAVNVSSIALMAGVTIKLSQSALTNWQSWLIALTAGIIGMRSQVSTSWLIIGGALLGWILF